MKALLLIALVALISGCATPDRLVYGSGFSFANYDYMVVGKPGEQGATTLYGLDVEFANLMTKYGFRVVGNEESKSLSPEQKIRTLQARLLLAADKNHITVTESFDDLITGRAVASVTGSDKGDIFDGKERGKVFESVSSTLIKAISQDKGLVITDNKR